MGFYERRILPKLLDMMMNTPENDQLRREVLAPARGRLLDLGFGSGLNAAHYPAAVTSVVGIDPNPGMEKLARQRVSAATMPIRFQIGSAERLPFTDASFDTVVTTLTLCTIDDVQAALREARRVLTPDGRYVLFEHGLSEEPQVQKWQHRLNGLNMRMLGHCRLNRPIATLVTDAGFTFQTVKQAWLPGAPKFAGWMTLGVAVPTQPANRLTI
jgi:ubiquinone/menaquinone biosynthesis C-methylase UbiE